MLSLLSLFSGIGAFEKALEREKIPFEIVNYCEIDKYASKAYSLIHNISEDKNLGDITKIDIDKLKGCDMICHGSPCQDFSIQGKQSSGDEGSGTQSSLMWYSVKIIKKLRPKYVIWENVPNVLSKKHKHNFDKYLDTLQSYGYTNSYAVLNAVDFGIPQNRRRIYCVSVLNGKKFIFPDGQKSNVSIADIMENKVDEKYYIGEDKIKNFVENTKLCKPNKIHLLGRLQNINGFDQCKRLYGIYGVSPTLCTCDGGNITPKIACAVRGRYYNGVALQNIEFRKDSYSNTVTTVSKDSLVLDDRVRELTPL